MPMKKVVGNGVSGRRVAMARFAFWPLRVFHPCATQKSGSVLNGSACTGTLCKFTERAPGLRKRGCKWGSTTTLSFAATVLSGHFLATATCGAVQGDVLICTIAPLSDPIKFF